jgi:hypothetical protein
VNLHRHLAPSVLDDLQHLGTPFLTIRKTAGPTQFTVYSHSFIPWHLETNSRRHWEIPASSPHRKDASDRVTNLANRSAKQPLSQGLVIRLLGPVGDHLSSLGSSKIGASFLGISRQRHRHRHVGLGIRPKLTSLLLRDIGKTPCFIAIWYLGT